MNSSTLLSSFLTEFDDSISSELNVDPLGLQVIWSAYGQKIFRNRISSISNDVRSYTLNLFNHWVVKSLVEDDGIVLGRGLQKVYASKDEITFKHACLIYLENLFVYSMIASQNNDGVETGGVLGVSNARRKWAESKGNPQLIFSHDTKAYVLVRQTLLGVSGRYKTPLLQIGFFDSRYQYCLPAARPLWQKAGDQLVQKSVLLSNLYCILREHLGEVLSDDAREPLRDFNEIPPSLIKALVAAFRTPASVGEYACDFWLAVTELDQGAPGALYSVLKEEAQNKDGEPLISAVVFAQAIGKEGLSTTDIGRLNHVRQLEPFLSELDLMFNVMLSAKSQSLDEIAEKWKSLGREPNTLGKFAEPIAANQEMRDQLAGTGAERLKALLKIATEFDFRQQLRLLLAYHVDVMNNRGQFPWLRLLNEKQLKIDVRSRELPVRDERPLGGWVNQYYIPQFRNFLSGLWGIGV